MRARGLVVNTKTNMIHKAGCTFARRFGNTQPLSKIPAPMRKKFSLCGHCKPS